MIIYTRLLDRGITLCPSAIIIPAWAKNNLAYLAHEERHVEQMRDTGTLKFWWKYLTDKAFKQKVEVEAFRAQIAAGESINYCAGQLKNNYGLTLTFNEALSLLS